MHSESSRVVGETFAPNSTTSTRTECFHDKDDGIISSLGVCSS